MKGLLYASAVLNKMYFIAVAIAAIVGTAAGILVQIYLPESETIQLIVQTLAPLITLGLYSDWQGRELEQNIKTRFADSVLAAGISKNTFVLTEFFKNLLTVLYSYALVSVMLAAYLLAGREHSTRPGFWEFFELALLIGLKNMIVLLFTMLFKSMQKASIFVDVFFVAIIIASFMVSSFGDILDMLEYLFKAPASIIISAFGAAYILIYTMTLIRVKGGDVC